MGKLTSSELDERLFDLMATFMGEKDPDGYSFQWRMDDLTNDCDDEQWTIVCDTLDWVRDEVNGTRTAPQSEPPAQDWQPQVGERVQIIKPSSF
jgi:hypothetical protein